MQRPEQRAVRAGPVSPRTVALGRLALLATMLLVVGIVLAVSGTDGVRDLLADVGESRWGVVAFVFAYALAVVLLLPGTLATMTAGAIFGFPYGGFVALTGATFGATAAFFLSRSMGRSGVQELLGSHLDRVDGFVARNDFTSILLLRLMPVVPFNLLNYGSGLTSVRPSRYVIATILGMAPGAFLTTALADQADDPTSRTFLILLGLFLVALLGSVVLGKRLRSERTPHV